MARHLTLLLVLCALALLFALPAAAKQLTPTSCRSTSRRPGGPVRPQHRLGLRPLFLHPGPLVRRLHGRRKGLLRQHRPWRRYSPRLRGSNGPIIQHLADGGFITTGGHMNFSPADLDDMAKGGWYVPTQASTPTVRCAAR